MSLPKPPAPRVLVVTPYIEGVAERGGPAKSVWAMCRGMAASGADVTVFTIAGSSPHVQSSAKVDTSPLVVQAPMPRWLLPICKHYRMAPGVFTGLRHLISDADIVLIQGVFSFPAIVACHLARKRGVPFVLTPRGQLQVQALQRKRLKKALFHRLVARRALSSAAAIHFTSELERERSRAATSGRRTFVVGNGFDFNGGAETRDTQAHNQGNQCRLGIVGFIDARKGFDILLPALARAPGHIHLQIVGPGIGNGKKLVERIIDEQGLGDRVRFSGFLQGRALVDAYRSFDYLVAPSMSESFGNTVVEALGLGVPVIVNPNVPLADLVREQGLGLVVENTVEGWAAALTTVAQGTLRWDPQRLSRVARDRFDYRAVGVKLKESLAAVLRERSASIREATLS